MPLTHHPLSQFEYCPRCGDHGFVPNNAKSNRCKKCGFVYYINPSSACAVLITDSKNNLLVAVRAHEPAKGTYDLPGGFADLNESIEQSVARELLEETDMDINSESVQQQISSPLRYLFSEPNTYLYSGFEVPTADLIFHIGIMDLTAYAGKGRDDVSELLLIPLSELNPEFFGLPSIKKVIRRVITEPELLR
ncbi:NUDIX domain-containing protein [Porphyromonas sp.]|uniref:NUDIX hydrolase n=1 Tax=Porphyromonas sp. TaxID=1924944 RepID=UPI0026DB5685|nr:NUDIX domain-containing protein [Porphyromonas sp.]MDO4771234.1 NUDIX domain-containing protein [Porphyromonas sp.]